MANQIILSPNLKLGGPPVETTSGVSTVTSPQLLKTSLEQADITPPQIKSGQVLPLETDLGTINAIRSSLSEVKEINKEATFQKENRLDYQIPKPQSSFTISSAPAQVAGAQVTNVTEDTPNKDQATFPIIPTTRQATHEIIEEPKVTIRSSVQPAMTTNLVATEIKSPDVISVAPSQVVSLPVKALSIPPAPTLGLTEASVTPVVSLKTPVKPLGKAAPKLIIPAGRGAVIPRTEPLLTTPAITTPTRIIPATKTPKSIIPVKVAPISTGSKLVITPTAGPTFQIKPLPVSAAKSGQSFVQPVQAVTPISVQMPALTIKETSASEEREVQPLHLPVRSTGRKIAPILITPQNISQVTLPKQIKPIIS